MAKKSDHNRRAFLTGRGLLAQAEAAGETLAETIIQELPVPRGGTTVQLQTRAMACDFAVLLNRGEGWMATFSDGLDQVHALEQQLTVYRDNSELSHLNRTAAVHPVPVEPQLWELLRLARQVAEETGGAFDPTAGPLVALWRQCKQAGRVPTAAEITAALALTGWQHIQLKQQGQSLHFDRPGVEINLGGIGKGYALDRIGTYFRDHGERTWLLHGGRSSVLACGSHNETGGWPIGLQNPLFPDQHLATILLRDQAMSTSGSGTQFFTYRGKRYGHLLDPRTGWPVEGMLSATVLAPTAALADALSTAFFVMGLEKTHEYCQNNPQVSALLIPPPRQGRRLEPVVCGIPENSLFFHSC